MEFKRAGEAVLPTSGDELAQISYESIIQIVSRNNFHCVFWTKQDCYHLKMALLMLTI